MYRPVQLVWLDGRAAKTVANFTHHLARDRPLKAKLQPQSQLLEVIGTSARNLVEVVPQVAGPTDLVSTATLGQIRLFSRAASGADSLLQTTVFSGVQALIRYQIAKST